MTPLISSCPACGHSFQPWETDLEDLVSLVSQITGIDETLLLGPRRRVHETKARFLLYALAVEYRPALSVAEIARQIGRDHTTVFHGLQRARTLAETDEQWRSAYLTAKSVLDRLS